MLVIARLMFHVASSKTSKGLPRSACHKGVHVTKEWSIRHDIPDRENLLGGPREDAVSRQELSAGALDLISFPLGAALPTKAGDDASGPAYGICFQVRIACYQMLTGC